MHKILFIYYQNGKQGGVSKSISNITKELLEKGYDVTILLMLNSEKDFYPIDSRVKRVYLDSFNTKAYRRINHLNKRTVLKGKLFKLLYYTYDYGVHKMLKEWVNKNHSEYDTIITCWYKLSTTLTYTQAAHKTIAWEHINHRIGGLIFFKLLRKRYSRLGKIVCLTEESRAYYAGFHNDVHIIPNIIGDVFENASPKVEEKENIILLASRMDPEKNVAEFLDIVRESALPSNWKVKIAGAGLEEEKLREKVSSEKILNVEFLGSVSPSAMPDLFAESKIFCMTSLSEGLPTTLIEAMFFSNVLIAYDCPTGPSEIVNETNGYLIPLKNKEKFIEKLRFLVHNDKELNKLMYSSQAESKKWKKETIISKWETVLNHLVN